MKCGEPACRPGTSRVESALTTPKPSAASSAAPRSVATRPDAPRPLQDYYDRSLEWDADQAVEDASRRLGWEVRYEVPTDTPHTPGMPRPVDVIIAAADGQPVNGLGGRLLALRPSDPRLNRSGTLTEIPHLPGRYRTLIQLDEPGVWELGVDARKGASRFVHSQRVSLAEEGWNDGDIAQAIIRRYLEEATVGGFVTDTIILGCTHFPLLRPTIERVFDHSVTVVDSASTTAAVAGVLLEELALAAGSGADSGIEFLATDGATRFARVGGQFLGEHLSTGDVSIVDL